MDKTRRGYCLMVFAVLILISPNVNAVKKIIFYEINTPGQYLKSGGLSEFAGKVRDNGYEISSISKGTLSRDVISNYDILVINPAGQLRIEEISSILWFVTTKGGGVLILGDNPSTSNQLMIPFGMTVDDGILIDSVDTIPGMDATNFVIDRFSETEKTRIIRKGVTQLGFYNGHGMLISGSAECIATGDSDVYSDSQSFQTGSDPCIAGAALFGRGLIFGLSDGDMITNDHINSYDNTKFAQNIIDWLSITVPSSEGNFTYEECQVMIGQLKLEKLRIEQERDNIEKNVERLEQEKDALIAQVEDVTAKLNDVNSGKIGPFTRSQWAIVVAGLLFLIAALVLSRRGGRSSNKKKEEDILGEIGYEFEEAKTDKGDGKVEAEIDTKALDKELEDI